MTKQIKTATAWGPKVKRSGLVSVTPMRARPKGTLVPVVIVHGQTEAKVHEAAALLEKSKEVCEWVWSDLGGKYKTCGAVPAFYVANFCPSCGRKVVVK